MSSAPGLEPPTKKPRVATDHGHYLQDQQKVYSEAEVCTATNSSWEKEEEAAERVPSPGRVRATGPLAVQHGHLPKDGKHTSVKRLSLSLKRVTPRTSLTGHENDKDEDQIGKDIRKSVSSEFRGKPEEYMESSVGADEEGENSTEKEEVEHVLMKDVGNVAGHITGPLVAAKHGHHSPNEEKLQRATVKRLALSLKKVTPRASFATDVRNIDHGDAHKKKGRKVEDQIGKDNSGRPEVSMEPSVSISEETEENTENTSSEYRGRADESEETSVGVSDESKKATKNVSSKYRVETDCEATNIDDREETSNIVGSCGLREEVGVEGIGKMMSSMEPAVGTSEENENAATMSSLAMEGEMDENLENENSATSLSVEVSPMAGHAGKSEAYYSANFKSAINSVLTSSPERHVINGEAVKIVDNFMALPG